MPQPIDEAHSVQNFSQIETQEKKTSINLAALTNKGGDGSMKKIHTYLTAVKNRDFPQLQTVKKS